MRTLFGNRAALILVLIVVAVTAAGAGLKWGSARSGKSKLAVSGRPSIIVVPLVPSGSGTDPWSGAGLAEEIRVALAANAAVAIRRADARTSGAPGKAGDSANMAMHARRAGADYVLTGTVGRNAGKNEIGLRLVRASDATTAWSGMFWRSPNDLSTFAADLAAAVTEAIAVERGRNSHSREPRR